MSPINSDSVEAIIEQYKVERDSLMKRIEELSGERNDLLKGVLEYLPDPVAQIGPNHRIIWGNLELRNREPNAIGSLCYEVLCKRESPRLDCPCARALTSGRFESGIIQVMVNGQPEYWDMIGVPVNASDGRPTSVIEIRRNATDREAYKTKTVALEKELQEAQQSAHSARKAKSEFISNTSHEIRTPMNGIMGMIQLLERSSMDAAQQELLRHLRVSAERLMGVVDGILDISSLERDEMVLIEEEFHLGDWLKYTVASKEKLALSKGLSLEYRIASGTPEQVITDKYRLSQVVSNIIDNSIKFSRVGNIDIVGSCQFGNDAKPFLNLKISDSGIGIPEDKLESIFENFSQADGSLNREYSGAGLGLSISRKIIERMEGKIEVQSVYGVGTTFVVQLPIQLSDFEWSKQACHPSIPNPEIKPVPVVSLPTKKILVAEDEMLGRITMKFMLKDRYEIIFAKNGKEAIERYFADKPDLVLMDIMMPQMNGFEAFDAIEKETGGNRVPIVACTAKVIKTEREYLISYGFDDYLSKPIDMKKLNQILDKYLNSVTVQD